MNNLTELQKNFQHYLLDSAHCNIKQAIVSTAQMPAEKRLGIYSYAYYARLVEALAATYPALHIYLGQENFEQLGNEYAAAYPSTYRSIRWFGDRLAVFLQSHQDYKNLPYLAELAQIEWNMSAVFDSPDYSPLQIEALAAIPPDAWVDMQLQLHPSVHRIDLNWNTIEIWQTLINDQALAPPKENKQQVSWIFWRKELVSQYCSLKTEDAWALDALLNNENFGALCEGLTQWKDESEVAIYAASLLKGWILAGLIASVKI